MPAGTLLLLSELGKRDGNRGLSWGGREGVGEGDWETRWWEMRVGLRREGGWDGIERLAWEGWMDLGLGFEAWEGESGFWVLERERERVGSEYLRGREWGLRDWEGRARKGEWDNINGGSTVYIWAIGKGKGSSLMETTITITSYHNSPQNSRFISKPNASRVFTTNPPNKIRENPFH